MAILDFLYILLCEVGEENSERLFLKTIDIIRQKLPKANEGGAEAH